MDAAGGYASRLEGVPRQARIEHADDDRGSWPTLPQRCAAIDARLRAQAAVPDGPCSVPEPGEPDVGRDRPVLAQAIHHATEHRAQIAGALAAHGIDAIDLDELDLWAYVHYDPPIPRPQSPAPTASAPPVTILTPKDGDVVTTDKVTFTGTAPASATIYQTPPGPLADEVRADDGVWRLVVQLQPGDNQITIRAGDEGVPSDTVHVTYKP